MSERITQAELARRLKVTRGAISKAVKSGRITPDEAGLFDPAQAEMEWLSNSRPKAARGKGEQSSYAQARARKEHALARMAELKLGIAQGQFLEKAEVDRALEDVVSFARFGLETLPGRVAPALVGLDHAGIAARLRDEIIALMGDMHREAVRQLKTLEEAGTLSRVDLEGG